MVRKPVVDGRWRRVSDFIYGDITRIHCTVAVATPHFSVVTAP